MNVREPLQVQGFRIPAILYGTAWKEEQTSALVEEALLAGFRGIDTANQRKHYHEAGVGEVISRWLREAKMSRDELFIQTKFTYVDGQDSRLPYDRSADPETQVRQSFESSLEHLGLDRIDSLLLHGPSSGRGLSHVDRQVWKTMEALRDEGKVRFIGASNMSAQQIELLFEVAEVKPAFIQNRCYARFGWDRAVREVCSREGVIYQGFSLLTANVGELRHPSIRQIAQRHGLTVAQTVFCFAHRLGLIPLTGTTDRSHMDEDLASLAACELSDEEIGLIERISRE